MENTFIEEDHEDYFDGVSELMSPEILSVLGRLMTLLKYVSDPRDILNYFEAAPYALDFIDSLYYIFKDLGLIKIKYTDDQVVYRFTLPLFRATYTYETGTGFLYLKNYTYNKKTPT